MRITVERKWPSDKTTIGLLSVDGMAECFTLEDVVREVQGKPVSEWKIPGKTAIPRGAYRLELRYSPHFQREMPMLSDVPGYTYVYLHPGNTAADTEGCILVGASKGQDEVLESRKAYDALFPKIQTALAGGDTVTLEVA